MRSTLNICLLIYESQIKKKMEQQKKKDTEKQFQLPTEITTMEDHNFPNLYYQESFQTAIMSRETLRKEIKSK